jgi:hypothetical protein
MTDMTVPGDLLARAKVIAGLRQLADYLAQHPDLPVNAYGWDLAAYPSIRDSESARRAEVDRIAATLDAPVTDERGTGGHYFTARCFGLVTYQAISVSDERRAAYNALMSYSANVTPEPGLTAGVAS